MPPFSERAHSRKVVASSLTRGRFGAPDGIGWTHDAAVIAAQADVSKHGRQARRIVQKQVGHIEQIEVQGQVKEASDEVRLLLLSAAEAARAFS